MASNASIFETVAKAVVKAVTQLPHSDYSHKTVGIILSSLEKKD